jgi:hypothetical protein
VVGERSGGRGVSPASFRGTTYIQTPPQGPACRVYFIPSSHLTPSLAEPGRDKAEILPEIISLLSPDNGFPDF